MENDEEAYRVGLASPPRSSHSNRLGQRSMQSHISHGANKAHDNGYEETPLLAQEIGRLPENESAEPVDRAGGAQEWSGANDFAGQSWWNRPSINWLMPPFLLYTFAFGGVIVPRINLILDLICREYLCSIADQDPTFQFLPVMLGTGDEQCRHLDEVQRRVTRFTLYMGLIAGLLSAFTSPKLGEISDRYGRRKLTALTATGSLIAESIIILAARYPDKISVNWILLGEAFDGICGSFTAAMALTYAYTSDCTAPSKRAVAFAYFHGCLFGGIAVGPLISGFIVKTTGNILNIFYFALAFHAVFVLSIGFVIPESLSKQRQMQARKLRREKQDALKHRADVSSSLISTAIDVLNPASMLAPLAILWPTESSTNPLVRRNIALLAAIDTTMFGVAMGSMNVIMLYAEYIFDWGTPETSVFLSIANLTRVTSLLVVLPLIVRWFRGPASKAVVKESGSDLLDLSIIRVAIVFDMLGYIGYAIVRMSALFIISGALAAIGGMGSPTISSAMTKHVPPERTGQLLGAMGLLHALARVVSPVIFSLIYSSTVGKFTQTVFVCLAATWGLAFFLSWFLTPHVHWDEAKATEAYSEAGVEEGDIVR
ncbi:MAG: hypothetical protein HETSPECPRED_009556 [Heterodermia speciosa]|uniref:Major facilitator superfamily (MFS) profile domain-containing protein n=1 Tax=Heterodermia speciosa TaxID=116794 RepID=A0A8H3EPU1_9LECA|nr:MAG: hypothetical protein HETSPECPRED_009556 [Heterodermia speciosa]